jgi:hypothetical protein
MGHTPPLVEKCRGSVGLRALGRIVKHRWQPTATIDIIDSLMDPSRQQHHHHGPRQQCHHPHYTIVIIIATLVIVTVAVINSITSLSRQYHSRHYHHFPPSQQHPSSKSPPRTHHPEDEELLLEGSGQGLQLQEGRQRTHVHEVEKQRGRHLENRNVAREETVVIGLAIDIVITTVVITYFSVIIITTSGFCRKGNGVPLTWKTK